VLDPPQVAQPPQPLAVLVDGRAVAVEFVRDLLLGQVDRTEARVSNENLTELFGESRHRS
jgi:hypothetical protein